MNSPLPEVTSLYELKMRLVEMYVRNGLHFAVRASAAHNCIVLTYTDRNGELHVTEHDRGRGRFATLNCYMEVMQQAEYHARKASLEQFAEDINGTPFVQTAATPAVWELIATAKNGARMLQSREWFAVCEAGQEPHTYGVFLSNNKQDAASKFAYLCWQPAD